MKATPELVSLTQFTSVMGQRQMRSILQQLRKNLFGSPYAHALIAFSGSADAPGEAVGLALYFFNYSTWTGRPGLYVSSSSLCVFNSR